MMRKRWFMRATGGLACAAMLTAVLLSAAENAAAQEGQGKYITEATQRLLKLVDKANADGYKLDDNQFSIGGGWLKQSTSTWVSLFNLTLEKGKSYRIVAAGDHDTKDLDLQILDAAGKVVKEDVGVASEAIVNFQAPATQKYQVRLRLYASAENVPCVCLALVLEK